MIAVVARVAASHAANVPPAVMRTASFAPRPAARRAVNPDPNAAVVARKAAVSPRVGTRHDRAVVRVTGMAIKTSVSSWLAGWLPAL